MSNAMPAIGELIADKYLIEAVLGEGGYGVVFRATTMGTGRPAAVKVLKANDGNDTRRAERFMRELRAIARLESRHTVTLFDYGRTPAGALFMVCEYVDGLDLVDLMATRLLTEAETIHILLQVLASLGEAHDIGVLHRDVKPANIRLFAYMDDPLCVKVLDFGLVKSFGESEASLTATGHVVGTVRFMTPEQIRGEPLSAATDIYSLGLVAYDMLLGVNSRTTASITKQSCIGPETGVSEDLRGIINRMLAHDRSVRYRNAAEVIAELAPLTRKTALAPVPPGVQRADVPESATTEVVAATEETAPPDFGNAVPAVPDVPDAPQNQTAPATDGWTKRGILVACLAFVVGVIALIATSSDSRSPSGTSVPPQLLKTAPSPRAAPARPAPVESQAAPDLGTPTEGSPGCAVVPDFMGFGMIRELRGLTSTKIEAFLPPAYDGTVALPLVLLLHETGVSPREFMRTSQFDRVARRENVLVIAPFDGNSPTASWEDEEDIDFVRDALRIATEKLCVDEQRIYIVGHGSGGNIAERAPCELPQIRAVAASAHRAEQECAAGSPIPSIYFAGLKDLYNPVDGGMSCSGHKKRSLADKEELRRVKNRCSAMKTPWPSHPEGKCFAWTECDAALVSCHVSGGRRWNDAPVRIVDKLSGNNCDGPPTNFPYAESIWQFFEEQEAGDVPEAEP